MKTQLLILTSDKDYAEHVSNILAEKYADAICATVCSEAGLLREQIKQRRFDVALLDETMLDDIILEYVRLPLLLWHENDMISGGGLHDLKKIRRYQRISHMVSEILELYSKSLSDERGTYLKRARITAVWSPMGGVGKTTIALAYSAGRSSEGKQTLYLNMEPFSSIGTYFGGSGKGISAVFEMLETGSGNIEMLARSLLRQDGSSEIAYFCAPDNFDDMNILTPENTATLIDACAGATEELVIDMSCICDESARRIFDISDRILIVIDQSRTSQLKFAQFTSQNSVFQRIRGKSSIVANKGAAVNEPLVDTVITLPMVQSTDAVVVYMTLASFMVDNN